MANFSIGLLFVVFYILRKEVIMDRIYIFYMFDQLINDINSLRLKRFIWKLK